MFSFVCVFNITNLLPPTLFWKDIKYNPDSLSNFTLSLHRKWKDLRNLQIWVRIAGHMWLHSALFPSGEATLLRQTFQMGLSANGGAGLD